MSLLTPSVKLYYSLLKFANRSQFPWLKKKHSKCIMHVFESSPLMSIISVETCLRMCGLEAFADATVGSLGVEQRKRATIGVELAAKATSISDIIKSFLTCVNQPRLLLFLDEPTSGLDSQSAWAIMAFLRELADHGQAILCTYVATLSLGIPGSYYVLAFSIHQVMWHYHLI